MDTDTARPADQVEVPTDDGSIPTHRFGAGQQGPVIVLLQEIFGVSAYIRSRAADLAGLGYLVLVPEIYWRLDGVQIDEGSDQALTQAMTTAGRLDWDRAVADAAAVVRYARTPDPEGTDERRVGLVGFCFGGGLAFNVAAVELVACLVSYYGSALPGLLGLADRVTVPSLHHFGEADDYLPLDAVDTVRAAVGHGPQIEVHTYPGANHAFDGPMPGLHHEASARLAWRRTVEFLGRVLPVE